MLKRMLTLVDQLLFTGTNFLLALFLTLDSGVSETGDYALLSSVAIMLHSLFSGAVTEPMTIYGSAEGATRIRLSYAKVAGVAVLGLLGCGIGGYAVALMLKSRTGSNIALGAILFACQAIVLCHKRYLYIVGKPHSAVAVSARYALISIIAAAISGIVYKFGVVQLAVVLMLASAVASFGWGLRVSAEAMPLATAIGHAWSHRRFTLWLILSGIPATIATQSIYWIADFRIGKEGVGRLKLFEQLAAPGQQVVSAVTIADQVESASDRAVWTPRLLWARTRKNALQYVAIAATFVPVALALAWLLGRMRADIGVVAGVSVSVYLIGLVAQSWSASWNVAARILKAPEIIAVGYCVMAAVIIATALLLARPTLTKFAAIVSLGWVVQSILMWGGVRMKLGIRD